MTSCCHKTRELKYTKLVQPICEMATASEGAFKAKVVLLGEGAVGKTSIVTRYVENRFNDKHVSTLQVS